MTWKTWLSATFTDQETCLDALQELNSTLVDDVRTAIENSTKFANNSLAIMAKILGLLFNFNIPINQRRLLTFEWEF
jgi:hypothetical protein